MKNPQTRRITIFIAVILAILIGITLGNITFARSHPGGNEFLVQWTAIRTFLKQGESPYSKTATTNIQTNIYGNPAQTGEISYRFTEPLYTMLLYAPFALIKDYAVARGIWSTLIEGCLLGIAYLSLKFPQRRSPLWLYAVSFALVTLSFSGIRPLVNGSDAIVVTLLLTIAIYSIANENDEVAAIALAFATIRPLLTTMILVFVLVWAIIKRRSTFLYWFFGTLILLIGFSVLLIPNWLVQNLQAYLQFIPSLPAASPGALMIQAWGAIGMRISVFWSVLLGGILLFEWIGAFKSDTRHFIWVSFLTLGLSQWIGIPTEPENFLLLYPGILFGFLVLLLRWNEKARAFVQGITVFLIGIPWLLALTGTHRAAQQGEKPILFFVVPFVSILLLYWTKWWTIRPKQNQGLNTLNGLQ